jgi:hypothetical protein
MKRFYDVVAYTREERYRISGAKAERFRTMWGAKRYAKKLAAKVPHALIEICRVETPRKGIYYSEVIYMIGEG